MQRWTRLAHAVTAITVAAALWAPPSARAATVIHVPGDFTTIQAAIDAASAGDTIRVEGLPPIPSGSKVRSVEVIVRMSGDRKGR